MACGVLRVLEIAALILQTVWLIKAIAQTLTSPEFMCELIGLSSMVRVVITIQSAYEDHAFLKRTLPLILFESADDNLNHINDCQDLSIELI